MLMCCGNLSVFSSSQLLFHLSILRAVGFASPHPDSDTQPPCVPSAPRWLLLTSAALVCLFSSADTSPLVFPFRLRWSTRSVAPCTRGWRAQSPVAQSIASWPILSSSPCQRRRPASRPSRRPEMRSNPSPAPPPGRGEEESHPASSPAAATHPSELLLLLLIPLHQHPMCHSTN